MYIPLPPHKVSGFAMLAMWASQNMLIILPVAASALFAFKIISAQVGNNSTIVV
jgi:hypothetical protein